MSTTDLTQPQRLDREWGLLAKSMNYHQLQGSEMTRWNILKTTYKVSDFLSWQKDDALILSPDFQRRPLWPSGAKSYLMDTIIKGFPIPIILLRDRRTSVTSFVPKREVVDGQQRLRTVISFINPQLLKDFKHSRDNFVISKWHNDEFKGMSFKELPPRVQQDILDYQFTVNVFPSNANNRDIKEVFARMNATGYKLNAQELRNAEFYGAFKTLIAMLANEQLNRWESWKVITQTKLARMQEVELTSEFVVVMLKGVSEKKKTLIDDVYRENENNFPHADEVTKRARLAFNFIDNKLTDGMRQPFQGLVMFYALLAAIYDLQFGIGSSLKASKPRLVAAETIMGLVAKGNRIMEKTAPANVIDAATKGTNHVNERKRLIGYLVGRHIK